MKQTFKTYKNWRVSALVVLCALVVVLALSESEDLTAFVVTKALAVAFGALAYQLAKRWAKAGKLESLRKICEEE